MLLLEVRAPLYAFYCNAFDALTRDGRFLCAAGDSIDGRLIIRRYQYRIQALLLLARDGIDSRSARPAKARHGYGWRGDFAPRGR